MAWTEWSIPQIRGSDEATQPASLDVAMASETALDIALDSITIQGIGPRPVTDTLEALCVFKFQRWKLAKQRRDLDSMLRSWRERPLVVPAFTQVGAPWCKCDRGGLVPGGAVRVAAGIYVTAPPEGFDWSIRVYQ